jgi:hypothetical protein
MLFRWLMSSLRWGHNEVRGTIILKKDPADSVKLDEPAYTQRELYHSEVLICR